MPRTLACPASLKGVLSARDAAAALAEGLHRWSDVDELPVADGGEGTLDVLQPVLEGEWREADVHDAFGRPRRARWLELPTGEAAVEAAEAIPLDPRRLDPIAASSRGLGELILAVGRPRHLHLGLGGTANVDAGAGLLEVVDELPAPTSVACDVEVPLIDAVRLFAAQKGATAEQLPVLEARRAPERPAGSAARWPRSVRSSCPEHGSCSTCSASTPRHMTSSSRVRAPSTRPPSAERRLARSRAGAGPQVCAASSSAGVSPSPYRMSRRSCSRATLRGPGRTSRSSDYGLADSVRRASSSIFPWAASSWPTQSL